MPPRAADSAILDEQRRGTGVGRAGLLGLIAAAALTVALWQLPGGNYILYPFTILATWFHEMAHGLMALFLGGSFTKLLVFSNGSGAAYYSGPLLLGSMGKVLVAAAGPMGPPVAGAALILTSRSLKAASLSLKLLGGFLLISAAVWVRSSLDSWPFLYWAWWCWEWPSRAPNHSKDGRSSFLACKLASVHTVKSITCLAPLRVPSGFPTRLRFSRFSCCRIGSGVD